MNYLAHLYLVDDDPESLVGSLMGDFVKGGVNPARPPTIRHAILQHRRIDSFTDAHPLVKRSKQCIHPEFRRYAGILVDNDLLASYQTVDGIGRALRGVETRLRRPSRLGEAVSELENAYPMLCDDFRDFFPELIRFVASDTRLHSRST